MNLADVRAGLHNVLRTADGDLNVYMWPDPQPEPPCVLMAWPTEIAYHGSVARCVTVVTMTLTIMVATGDIAEATQQLDVYASSDGIVTTLEDASDAAWSNLTVVRATNWREISEVNVLAYDVELTIQA